MAALLIVAGFAIVEKVEKKKEKKRQKRLSAEARYRELQIETNERLSRQGTGSSSVVDNTIYEDPHDVDEEEEEEVVVGGDRRRDIVPPPPSYEDAVDPASRGGRSWLHRRRSSGNPGQQVGGSIATYRHLG